MGSEGKVKDVKNLTGELDKYLKMLIEACPTAVDDGDDEEESITDEEKDQLLAQLASRFTAAELADSSEDEENVDVETMDDTLQNIKDQLLAQSESRSSDANAGFAESSEREENGYVELTRLKSDDNGDYTTEKEELLAQSEESCSSVAEFPESSEREVIADVGIICITIDDKNSNTGSFEHENSSSNNVQGCDCVDLSSSFGDLSVISDVEDDEVEVISEMAPPASTPPDVRIEYELINLTPSQSNEDVQIVREVMTVFDDDIQVVDDEIQVVDDEIQVVEDYVNVVEDKIYVVEE